MSIYANVGKEMIEFHNFSFDKASSTFKSEVDSKTGLSLSIRTPIDLDDSFEEKEFLVFFFSKKELAESEIWQVYDKNRDRRIGWCIPVNALSSTEHGYASNIHFRRYAYVALKTGINSLQRNLYTKRPSINEDEPILLSEVLPESTALLVISKETIEGDFEISRWIPALAALGYFQLTSIDPEHIKVKNDRLESNEIYIIPTSADIGDLDHLTKIYSHAYPFEKNPSFQFFYLYQVIELLMELIFKNEQAKLVQKIISAQQDINTTKDILEGSYTNTSEKKRMGLLARNYCRCENEISELVSICNTLLRQLNKEEGTTLETTIYPIRNFLFHQFRNFPNSAEKTLASVVAHLSSLLPKLLGKFNYSSTTEEQGAT